MRKFSKRLLTGLLAVAMVFSLSGMTAFAAEEEDASVEPEVAAEAVEAEDAAAPVEEIEEEDSGIATLSAEDEIATIDDEEAYPESEHPYPNQTDETWSYTLEGAENGVYVTFDEQTSFEEDYDYLYIYDDVDNLIGAYTGTELAGATVYVPTAGFTVELYADQMVNDWGFAVTDVEAAGETIDLSTYGYATDPIDQVFVDDTPIAKVYLNGGYYQLTQDVDYTVSADTGEANVGETVEVTINGIGKYTGTLTTHAYVWDYDHQTLPESDHPYEVDTEKTWEYTVPDAENGIYVTFDERTETEEGYDFIYIYDGEDNLIGSYSGTELAGKTVYVPTANVKIHLSADYVYCYWGFAVTEIEAAGDKLDLGKAGSVKDPLDPIEVGEDFVLGDVTFGGETLVEGDDYTVSADTSTAGVMAEIDINGINDYTGTLVSHVFVYDDTAVTVTDFDIASAEHDDADEELNQTIIVTITFSEDIALTHEDLRDDMLITIAGEDVYYTDRDITYDVQNGNQLVITMVSTDWVAIYGGMLAVSDVWRDALVPASGEGYVYMEDQSGRIPIGIVANNDMIAATDAEPASTYVDVAHKANMRGMYNYSLVSTDAAGNETVLGTWTSHAHDFYGDITREYIASVMASSVNNLAGYSAEYTDGDTFFTMTADNAEEGETLAIRMDEIKATINEAHAPSEVVVENNIENTQCSFCGYLYEREPVEPGIAVQVTYADGSFESLLIDADTIDAILAEQPETSINRGSTPYSGQYVLITDLLSETLGLENVENLEVNSSDSWIPVSSGSYDLSDMYLYDGGGYYRLAVNNASQMVWAKYVVEFVVTVDQEKDTDYPESDHPYTDNRTEAWTYTETGAANGVYVTFDEQTSVEEGYDYIYIYDDEENLIGAYTGTELAGATVYVPTAGFTIELVADQMENDWGFAVTDVEAVSSLVDLGTYGYVEDPIEQVFAGDTPTAEVYLNGGVYTLTQDVDYTISADTTVAGDYTEVTITGIGKYTGTLTTHAYVWDYEHEILPESDHNYASNTDESWFYAMEDAENGVYVTFDEQTYTESGWDYIYIYDGEGNLFGRYSGSTLAGVTVCIPTSSFTIRLTSDSSVNYWGFAVTAVEAIGDSIDLGIAGSVDDPLEAVYVGETPTGFDVQVNFETLTEGVDYTVEADTSEANVGEYVEVSIIGMGDYSGTLTTHVFVYDETHPERYVTVTGFDIQSGEHEDADGEANQTIIATLTFSENIELAYEDLSNDILITINGEDVSTTARTITYEVQNGNKLVITMVSYDWVAIYNGQMTISNPTGEGLLAVSPSAAVDMEEQTGRIPTGIVVNNDRIRGTAAEPASTYVDVAHKANMRGMFAYELVSTDAAGNETILGDWTSHAHDFYGSVDEAYIANAIASDVATVEGYTVEYTEGDTFFIITADEAVAGERLAVRMVEINATINTAHAPAASYEENNVIYSNCSFCGEQYDKALNEGVGLAVQVTYSDGTFRSLTIDADIIDAILAEQPETTVNQGSSPISGQYILATDLLEQTLGLENITYLEFNSSDYWTLTSSNYDLSDLYMYDGGGYYRVAPNGGGMMNWVKYIIEIVVTVDQEAPEPYPESDHNYPNSTDQSWTYTLDGAENGVYVTFDERTQTESGYDYIYVYDGDDNLIGRYDGTTLAGATLCIPTSSFTIRLTSDSSVNYWGFAVTDVMAIGDSIDLGIAGMVDDPLEAVYVGETPTGFDVQVNFETLTEGVDYIVEADTSEANVGEYVEVSIIGIGDYSGTLTTHVFVYDETHPERYVTVTGFDIQSGEHDDADGEANQTIIATLTFSEDIELAYPDLSNDILITINGEDVSTTARTITYEVQNGNQLVITLVSYDWVAIYGGVMTISNPTGEGLLAVSPSAAVDMEEQTGRIPTGIVVNNDRIRATAEEPASTYVDVAHKANMRGMFSYELVSTNSMGEETILGSWTSHAHDFYGEVDEAYIANAIASDVATVDGYTVEYTEGDTFFIITADEAVAGERIAVRMVEINATINTAHAPTVSYEENNVIYSSCSFCGEQYDKALNEGVGLAVQITYADGTFESVTIDEDVIDAILAEQPETTVNQGSTPISGQYILVTDLLEQTLGLENITYLEFNSSDYWTRNSDSYNMDDIYLYDGGGYYRLAINGAGMMNWVKYIIEVVVTVDQEPPVPEYDDIPIYKDGEVVATITGEEFAEAQAEAPEQTFTYTSGSGTNEVTANFVLITDLLGDNMPDEGCGFTATAEKDDFTATFTEDYFDTAYIYYEESSGGYRTAVNGTMGRMWVTNMTYITLGHIFVDGVCTICGAEEPIEVDKTELDMWLTIISALNESQYTEESWGVLQEAIAAAESVSADPNATQEEVDEAVAALGEAVDNLVSIDDTDKTELNLAIAFVEDMLDEDDYTADSWAALQDALAVAQAVSADPDATQEEIDDAAAALEEAVNNLVPVPVDKTGLEDAIADALALNAEDFTEESWAAVQEALEAAQAVDDDEDATQDEVNEARIALVDAIAELVKASGEPTADKTELEDEFGEDVQLSENDYTPESWEAFAEALSNAQSVLTNPDATQDEVNEALAALQEAKANLEPAPTPTPAVDKEVLEAAISDAEGLDASNYTEDSWDAMQSALDAAKAVDEDPDASVDDVKQATMALVSAIAELQPAEVPPAVQPDKTDLLNEYVEGMKLDESNYTPESWEPFAQALADAQSVLTDPDATQDDVEAAEEALKTAMDNLVENGPVKNGLCRIEAGKLWGYYVDGVVDETYTGFASNENGDWWVVDGYVKFDVNSVEKDPTGKYGDKGVSDKGTWWYVIGNKVQHDFTGLANYKNANGWWYIKDGKVDFSHNGVDKNKNGWYYVMNGKVRFDFTGLSNYRNDNGWWYIAGGKVDFTHNGVDKNQNGWYYVTGGKVQFNYTGVSNYKNANGWWYIAGGKVDFTYTGKASNKNGTWNVVNGKVVF